jgi:hypothetical protein
LDSSRAFSRVFSEPLFPSNLAFLISRLPSELFFL